MEITEVRIKLMDDPHDRLQAFCSITFDSCFVIRDLKIIQGGKGSFVAMPSRKLTDRCPRCNSKNCLRSQFCSQCGAQLNQNRAAKSQDGRAKLYADIAHPINSECREMIQDRVLEAFEEEKVAAQLPGYVCRYDDYGEENFATLAEEPSHDSCLNEHDAPQVIRMDGTTHRIEPAAETPNAPHHGVKAPRHSQSLAQSGHAEEGRDEFGTGII